jgi:hypothetical protein
MARMTGSGTAAAPAWTEGWASTATPPAPWISSTASTGATASLGT